MSKPPYANQTQYAGISIARSERSEICGRRRRQRCNRCYRLLSCKRSGDGHRKRRWPPQKGDAQERPDIGPRLLACLRRVPSYTYAHSPSASTAAAEVQPRRERRRDTSLLRRYHKGRCACRHSITCALPCDQHLPLSHHRQSSSFWFAALSLFRRPSSLPLSNFSSSVSLRTRPPVVLSVAPKVLAMAKANRYCRLRCQPTLSSLRSSSFFFAGRCAFQTNASELLQRKPFLILMFSKLLQKKPLSRTNASELLQKKLILSYRHVITICKSSTSKNLVPGAPPSRSAACQLMTMRGLLLLIAALIVACHATPRYFVGTVPRKISFEPAKHATSNRRMTHEHVEAAATSAIPSSPASSVGLVNIPRGGAQDSIAVKTEGGNALVASILDVVGKVSPTLAGLLRMLFKIVESLTGLDLVPVKVAEKKPKKKSKAKKSGGGGKKRAAVVSDETSDEEEEVESAKAPPKKATPAKKKKPAGGGGSATANKHLSTNLKSTSPNYRIQRELKQFLAEPPPNLKVSVGKNIRCLLYTSPSPRDRSVSRMPSSA